MRRVFVINSIALQSLLKFIQRDASIGVSVNEMSSENSVAATTVRPYCRNNWPSTPLMNVITGRRAGSNCAMTPCPNRAGRSKGASRPPRLSEAVPPFL